MPDYREYITQVDPRLLGSAPATVGAGVAAEQGPGGLMALLNRPGVRQGMMATGMALLAQKDRRGSLGGALGNALPYGVQAFQQGQSDAGMEEAIAGLPPQMQQVLRALPTAQRAQALMQMMSQPEADPIALGTNERLVSPTGELLVDSVPEEPELERQVLADGRIGFFDAQGNLVRAEGPSKDTTSEEAEQAFSRTDRLADDYYREATPFIEMARAARAAKAAGNTAVGDQTRIIALNKLLDPQSIVREGEFDRVGQAGGLASRAQWYYQQLKEGRLPDDLRAAIDAEIDAQLATTSGAIRPVMDRFRHRATAARVDPTSVVFDPFDGITFRRVAPF